MLLASSASTLSAAPARWDLGAEALHAANVHRRDGLLAENVSVVSKYDPRKDWLAGSPTIAALGGRLFVAHDFQNPHSSSHDGYCKRSKLDFNSCQSNASCGGKATCRTLSAKMTEKQVAQFRRDMVMMVLGSVDGGRSWQPVAHVAMCKWGSLFIANTRLYVVCSAKRVEERRSSDINSGAAAIAELSQALALGPVRHWARQTILKNAIITYNRTIGVHLSPGNVRVHGGQVRIVIRSGISNGHGIAVLRASETANLFNPESWHLSNREPDAIRVSETTQTLSAEASALLTAFGIGRHAERHEPKKRGEVYEPYFVPMPDNPAHTPCDCAAPSMLIVARANTISKYDRRMGAGLACNLAVEFLLTPGAAERGEADVLKFMGFASVPGMGIAHSFVDYDERSGLYWMMGNVGRMSTRQVKGTKLATGSTSARSHCQHDRGALGLYYSRNMRDYIFAGFAEVGRGTWLYHWTYPHFIFEGDDLLAVTRAFAPQCDVREPKITEADMTESSANNHDSKCIMFHRISNFRSLVVDGILEFPHSNVPHWLAPRSSSSKAKTSSSQRGGDTSDLMYRAV